LLEIIELLLVLGQLFVELVPLLLKGLYFVRNLKDVLAVVDPWLLEELLLKLVLELRHDLRLQDGLQTCEITGKRGFGHLVLLFDD